jgi:uncharacterized protein YlxW (UPF0749 family)
MLLVLFFGGIPSQAHCVFLETLYSKGFSQFSKKCLTLFSVMCILDVLEHKRNTNMTETYAETQKRLARLEQAILELQRQYARLDAELQELKQNNEEFKCS